MTTGEARQDGTAEDTGTGSAAARPKMRARAKAALGQASMRQAVGQATGTLRSKRLAATAQLGHWEAWREAARRVRAHAISHLDQYLERFAGQVEQAGGHVIWADDAAQARSWIRDFVTARGARQIVKSKSMLTEEIGLNEALEETGARVTETDLGEFILQLADEPPSHLITPVIHKDREAIIATLSELAGEPLPDDTAALTAFARQILRQRFLAADVGITGVNFGVAESGSVCLVTNEGNGRMVNTLPPVHIAVMGMERVVASWHDLGVVLNVLARSATGQQQTAYVSVTTGPRRGDEPDGPDEFYVVIVDNGRSSLLGDPAFQEVLHCIRCGACLNVCPVYREIGGHAYDSVYSGPIGAVISPLLEGFESHGDLPLATSLCGACTEACPVKIPLHDMLIELRERVHEAGHTSTSERWAFRLWRFFFSRAAGIRWAAKLGRTMLAPFEQKGRIVGGPEPLASWTRTRNFPALPGKLFRDDWDSLQRQLERIHEQFDERPAAPPGGQPPPGEQEADRDE